MKNKKTIVISLISIASVLALTVFGYKFAKDYQIENRDVRIKNFEDCVQNEGDYDFKLAKEKGLTTSNEHVSVKYLELQSKYDKALSLFFDEKTSLNQLNAQLDSLNLIKVPKMSASKLNLEINTAKKNIKQKPYFSTFFRESYYKSRSHIKSDYLYLRNDIKIERLEKSDAKLLDTTNLNNLTEPDKEKIFDMISRTYIEVLKVKNDQLGEEFQVHYSGSGKETIDNKTIALHLNSENEYDDKGEYVDDERDSKKENEAKKLADEYSQVFSKELNCEIKIFVNFD